MKQWIEHPLILAGENVKLVPLEKEHFEELYEAASDPHLWQFIPVNCSERENFNNHYNLALEYREQGNHYPFVIIHTPTNRIIGSTRLFDLVPDDLKLEIGWTWITKEFWGTIVNLECKLLLLTYCFETLGTRRVQLKTKDTNIRSRTAIQKIGAKFEGVFRKDRIQANGVSRNTAYFSIIDDEWPQAKINLINLIEKKRVTV
jgi:RimJ/RimL family protein N-acetyltransferase